MSFSGSQQADLMQSALAGSYSWYHEVEGGFGVGDPSSEGSINIPWILDLALSEGNASTKAIADGANAWPEPEWGFDQDSPGQDIHPGDKQWIGGGIGGFIVSW